MVARTQAVWFDESDKARLAITLNNALKYDDNIELCKVILHKMMKKYSEPEHFETYISTQHYKQRLNKIARFTVSGYAHGAF
jgi:fructose-specific component phosphotransferase system IIB-like protein